MHGLDLKWHGHEHTIDVPPTATHVSTTFRLVIRNAENVWVRRPWMLEKGGLDSSEPATYFELALCRHLPLIFEDKQSVHVQQVSDLRPDLFRLWHVEIDATHGGPKVGGDRRAEHI
jgi:hypothetical protein